MREIKFIKSLQAPISVHTLTNVLKEDPRIEIELDSNLPLWSLWLSSLILSLALIIGLLINGATVLIFLRRKKLRHLVNFLLLLDCFSHILLCFICIPLHLRSVWSDGVMNEGISISEDALGVIQQVVTNFTNLYGTFLTLSIAVLRYRRLCWKKKDRFSSINAVKWSVTHGILALGLTLSQTWTFEEIRKVFLLLFINWNEKESTFRGESFIRTNLQDQYKEIQQISILIYALKFSLIFISVGVVIFCYIRVSQGVWGNARSDEKVMDSSKLKKSRNVHLRATIHSIVQILLILLTLLPHLYEETYRNFISPPPQLQQLEGERKLNIEKNYIPIVQRVQIELYPFYTQLSRVLAITLNYAFLVLGTPLAYIASCHRFREEFKLLLCGQMSLSLGFFQKFKNGREGEVEGTKKIYSVGESHMRSRSFPVFKRGPRRCGRQNSENLNRKRSSTSTNSSSVSSGRAKGKACKDIGERMSVVRVTKATSDIISTLTLHQYKSQQNLISGPFKAETQLSSSPSNSNSNSNSNVSNNSLLTTSTQQNQCICYSYSPLGSHADLYGNLV